MAAEKDSLELGEKVGRSEANGLTNDATSSGEANEESTSSSSQAFQSLLRQVGDFGPWQWRIFIITSYCGAFVAFHNLAAAFLAATPEHWCKVPGLQNLNTTVDLRNISIPWEDGGDDQGQYSSCSYYDRDWPELVASGVLEGETLPDLTTNITTKDCDQWHYDHSIYKTTVVEEWDLVCENKYLMSLVQSTFMAGVLVGALVLSELSDKYGRRTISLVSSVGLLVASVSITFTTHYATFLVLRFLVAAFGSGLFLPNFVILMEVVGPDGRTVMGMFYQIFFAVGFTILPLIAYFVREWRNLQLCISVPSTLLLLYYWILPESPRWLMMKGRYQDGFDILKKVAKVNHNSLPPQEELDAIVAKMEKEDETQGTISKLKGMEQHVKQDERIHSGLATVSVWRRFIRFFKSIITLVRTPNMRRRCLIIYFAWFVVSMVYYGLTFSSSNINASVYILVFLSGIVEIPSYILVTWTLKRYGRRLNLCVLFIICGAACLLILAVPKDLVWLNITLATLGKFFDSSAFGVAYIYSAELVPTAVRNVAVGTSSVCARIGSALAPFIVDLLGDLHYAVPSTVFGLLSIAAGMLSLLLPETSKGRLPETVEEVEAMPR